MIPSLECNINKDLEYGENGVGTYGQRRLPCLEQRNDRKLAEALHKLYAVRHFVQCL